MKNVKKKLTREQLSADRQRVAGGFLLSLFLTREPGGESGQRSRPFVQLPFDLGEVGVAIRQTPSQIVIPAVDVVEVSL